MDKDSTSVKQVASLGKKGEPTSNRGPSPQVKKKRPEKGLPRERRVSLLQDQQVLNGRVFEPTAKNHLGFEMRFPENSFSASMR